MANTYVIGIDPGNLGGLAFLDAATGRLVTAFNMPAKDGKMCGDMLAERLYPMVGKATAYVEWVASRPRQAGQFTFGVNTGVIHGVLHAYRIPFQLVAATSWKRQYGLKMEEAGTKRDVKNRARELAAQLFPQHQSCFSRVKDDGVAEAALIALYGLNLQLTK